MIIDPLLERPNCTVHSQVARLQGNLYIRKKTCGGAESFPIGPPASGTSFLFLSMIQTQHFSNSHSRAEIQHSLQPAACASLSTPADCDGIVGWLDVISGYAVVCVCGHTPAVIHCTHAQSQAHTLSLCHPLMQIGSVFTADALVLFLIFIYFEAVLLSTWSVLFKR